MASTGGEIVRIGRSGAFADAARPPDAVKDLTLFESVDDLEQRATLLSAPGRWPAGPRPGDGLGCRRARDASRRRRSAVAGRPARPDRRRRSSRSPGSGAVDPTDALWLGEPLDDDRHRDRRDLHDPRARSWSGRRTSSASAGRQARLQMSWRGLPAIANLRVDGVDDLRNGANGLAGRLRGLDPGRDEPARHDQPAGGPRRRRSVASSSAAAG